MFAAASPCWSALHQSADHRLRVDVRDHRIVDVSKRRATCEKRAIRKLDILSAQKRLVEFAECCERLPTGEHIRTDGVRGLEFAQRALLVEQSFREPFDAGRRPVRDDSSSHQVGSAGAAREPHQRSQPIGLGNAVAIGERDPWIAGATYALVPGCRRSALVGAQDLHARRKLSHQCDAFVGRAVVDAQDLESIRRKALREQRGQAQRQRARPVADRNDDADALGVCHQT